MNGVAKVALAVLAVLEVGAAVYVVKHNDAPAADHGVDAIAVLPSTPARTPSSTPPSTPAVPSTNASSATPLPVVAFLGDDWTAGTGASADSARFTTVVCTALHARERNFGVAGTGYAKSSDKGGAYRTRLDAVAAAQPAVVVVTGGRNDRSDDQGTVAERVEKLFADLRRTLPHAVLVAVAPFWGDSDQPAELVSLAAAVKKGVTDAGGSYLDLADPIHGHPNFMADDADPDDAGYAAIAAALEPELAPLLPH